MWPVASSVVWLDRAYCTWRLLVAEERCWARLSFEQTDRGVTPICTNVGFCRPTDVHGAGGVFANLHLTVLHRCPRLAFVMDSRETAILSGLVAC